MASASGHKWGQKIGEILEVANKRFLDFDSKGFRPARGGKKVSWEDKYGNSHDLDYVFEAGGTDHIKGKPVAFIESAWRR